jgi:hypothetical protein
MLETHFKKSKWFSTGINIKKIASNQNQASVVQSRPTFGGGQQCLDTNQSLPVSWSYIGGGGGCVAQPVANGRWGGDGCVFQ